METLLPVSLGFSFLSFHLHFLIRLHSVTIKNFQKREFSRENWVCLLPQAVEQDFSYNCLQIIFFMQLMIFILNFFPSDDHTRVVLDVDGDNIHDDYINANYIDVSGINICSQFKIDVFF